MRRSTWKFLRPESPRPRAVSALSPEFRTRVWGFEDLTPWFNVKAEGDPIGEVWLTGDTCVVETGSHAGKQLQEMNQEFGDQLVGSGHQGEGFPLLVKVLFPREKLSVQVHPDDTLAQKYGQPRGKTECWYALGAEPGAAVAVGFKPGVPTSRFVRRSKTRRSKICWTTYRFRRAR